MRRDLLVNLSQFDDAAVIAEARRRFTGLLAAPDSLRGAGRQVVLQIVARHADAATWDQLHALAQKATDATDRTRLYRDLGDSLDPVLADRALALALTKEPPPTDAPVIIAAVGRNHPEKAFAFAMAHRAQVEPMIEPTSRTSFFTRLAANARSAAILPQLNAFAATAPASARGEVTKAVASITYRLEVIAKRLPQVDAWIAAHPG